MSQIEKNMTSIQFEGTLFNHSSLLIAYLNPEFTFLKVNLAFATATGYDVSFFLGKNYFDLFPDENNQPFKQVIHTRKLAFFSGKESKYFKSSAHPTKAFWDFHIIAVKNSKDEILGLVLTLYDVTDHMMTKQKLKKSMGEDISRRLEIQDSFQQSGDLFQKMIENIFDVISIIGLDGEILFQSPSSERVFGYTPAEIIGKSAFDLIHPDDLPNILKTLSEGLKMNRKIDKVKCRFKHKDGSWKIVEAIGSNLIAIEGKPAIIVNTRDITEKKSQGINSKEL